MTRPTASPPESPGEVTARPRWTRVVSVDLAGFGALALVSLLAGLGINGMRHQPLPLVYRAKEDQLRAAVTRLAAGEIPARPPVPAPPPRAIGLEEFQALVAARRATVIDARSPFFYKQGHVPGAVNLPRERFEEEYTRAGNGWSARKADAIAVYCSGADCRDAQLVADALRALGFGRLLVYTEGWDEWSQSGLPQEK